MTNHIEFNVITEDIGKDTFKLEMPISLTFGNKAMEMKCYYQDGYFYSNIAGQQVKVKKDRKKVQGDIIRLFSNVSGSAFSSYNVEKIGSRTVINFDFKLNDGWLSALSFLDGMEDSNISKTNNLKILDITGRAIMNEDGKITRQERQVNAKDTKNGNILCFEFHTIFNNIEQPATVTLPDFSLYKEVEDSLYFLG